MKLAPLFTAFTRTGLTEHIARSALILSLGVASGDVSHAIRDPFSDFRVPEARKHSGKPKRRPSLASRTLSSPPCLPPAAPLTTSRRRCPISICGSPATGRIDAAMHCAWICIPFRSPPRVRAGVRSIASTVASNACAYTITFCVGSVRARSAFTAPVKTTTRFA